MKYTGENLLKVIICEAICGAFPNPSAMGNPEPMFEPVLPAEADGVFPNPSATENPEPISESVPQAKADLQHDEDENSETIELLTAKFRTQLGEDSEKPDDLIKPFTDNLSEILQLVLNDKMKFFVNDQSIRHAIEKHDLLTLTRILDNKIGHPIPYAKKSRQMICEL
jgi:hypothetical protein